MPASLFGAGLREVPTDAESAECQRILDVVSVFENERSNRSRGIQWLSDFFNSPAETRM
jgi:hypothetical protein